MSRRHRTAQVRLIFLLPSRVSRQWQKWQKTQFYRGYEIVLEPNGNGSRVRAHPRTPVDEALEEAKRRFDVLLLA
jgi:hypothetical protein